MRGKESQSGARLGVLGLLALVLAAPATANERREAYRRPASIPHPESAPYSEVRAELGRTLFFDPRLSGSNFLACSSCHNPGFSWGDGLPVARGHEMKPLARRTPTLLNAAWLDALMWDGRASSLEEQALLPVASPDEMALPLELLPPKLRAIRGYAARFEAAFPGEGLTLDTVARALAAFQRTIVSGEAPFDRWVEGDEDAISEAAKRGFALFDGALRCSRCHSGWRFTDDSFHDIGVRSADRGRGDEFPEIEAVQFAFKTPTLRNVSLRAPYMHNGSEARLADVIDLYDRGGRLKRPSLSPEIEPLGLTDVQKSDLLAFLQTLNGADEPVTVPAAPR